MAIKKSGLYSSLWASCDELRGGMDASQYKDYVLFMLFIKYVSDKYGDSDDFAPPVVIPKGASFKDMVSLKGNSDIGNLINTQVIQPLIDANQRLARRSSRLAMALPMSPLNLKQNTGATWQGWHWRLIVSCGSRHRQVGRETMLVRRRFSMRCSPCSTAIVRQRRLFLNWSRTNQDTNKRDAAAWRYLYPTDSQGGQACAFVCASAGRPRKSGCSYQHQGGSRSCLCDL